MLFFETCPTQHSIVYSSNMVIIFRLYCDRDPSRSSILEHRDWSQRSILGHWDW